MSDEVGYSPDPTPPEPQEPAQEPSPATIESRSKPLGGATGKGWLPGQSGNPGGRPRSLASMVRRQTRDGTTLVRLMYGIIKGRPFRKQTVIDQESGKVTIYKAHPSVADRIEAAKWLADRGWGKVKDVGDDAPRRPFMVILQGDKVVDPLDEPEAEVQAQERRPALPPPMPEIGFDLNLKDLEEPKG